MANTEYLRPSADIKLKHTPSATKSTTGYNMINEVTADGDSTTIFSTASKSTSVTKTSEFSLTGTMISGHEITDAKAVCVVKTSNADSCSLTVSVGKSSQSKGVAATKYTTYTYPLNATDITQSGGNTSANVTFKTVLKAGSKNTAKCFITQAYIEITTEEYVPPVPEPVANKTVIKFSDVKQRITEFIMSVCNNCKSNVSFSELKLNTRTVESTSYRTSVKPGYPVNKASSSTKTKKVTQNGWNKTFSKLGSSDVLDKVNKLFEQNKYVTAGQTVVTAANFYNVCYIVSRFIHDTVQIYASPCVSRDSRGNVTSRKVIIFDNTVDSFPYGKPEYVDKNYTAANFQTYFNNLFDQLFNVNINTVTYTMSA